MTDYYGLFSRAQLSTNPKKVAQLDQVAKAANMNQLLYRAVAVATGIPWYVVACIHFREAGQAFNRHLHNGDPLAARTVRVPAGRPAVGSPPFTWPESAADALSGRWRPAGWDLGGCLEFMERYNGLGYRERGVNSPYLWDFTSVYTSGLFVTDGTFDPLKTEGRPGCAAILKRLMAGYSLVV